MQTCFDTENLEELREILYITELDNGRLDSGQYFKQRSTEYLNVIIHPAIRRKAHKFPCLPPSFASRARISRPNPAFTISFARMIPLFSSAICLIAL